MIIVSACLVGLNCRYDGGNAIEDRVVSLLEKGEALPVCPEQMGGLPTPRSKAEMEGGDGESVLKGEARVITIDGKDITEKVLKGAEEVLYLARLLKIKKAILKDKSPSCAVRFIYQKGKLVYGIGVCTAMLLRKGVAIDGT